MFKRFTGFFKRPKITESGPMRFGSFPEIGMSQEERNHRQNIEEISLADFRLHKEALQHNLDLLYRSFLISLLALIVATAAVIIALRSHSNVTVRIETPKTVQKQ